MCHAAVWIIDGIKDGCHRRHWRAWSSKANSVHPDLDPITRCHSYDISYKFHYHCTRCDYKLGRHSKSVNLTDARCPYCLSSLRLDGPAGPAKINRYAQFVKDHYSEVKLRTPVGGHKAIMEKIREQYHNSCPKQ
ncbi:Acidic repeat-containing protein [Geodia barretti]|nr:Acidic repeat-containing protein [Geodia barretti]